MLSGYAAAWFHVVVLMLAMSFAYVGGMFLNDAFDRKIDALERPERPIPSKQVNAKEVFIAGFSMLAIMILIVTAVGINTGNAISAFVSASALCLSIVVYNCWHKGNPISPLLMGLCRLLVYICCALSLTAEPQQWVLVGAFITLAYLIGLTYTAKQEQFGQVFTLWPLAFLAIPVLLGAFYIKASGLVFISVLLINLWILYCLRLILRRKSGDIPRAVVRLIAGISLVDALLISMCMSGGAFMLGDTLPLLLLCYTAFGITLLLQRYVSGT